jgi:hypothetical protein
MRAKAHDERQETRPEKRCGGEDSDFERRVSELEEVDGKQDADVAVPEGAQALGDEQAIDGGVHERAPKKSGIAEFGRDTVLGHRGLCGPDGSETIVPKTKPARGRLSRLQ